MANDLDSLLAQIEAETGASDPTDVEILRAIDAHFAFAVELATARWAGKMTQNRLSELSRIQQSEISRFERGQRNLTIGRLLGALDCPVASAPRAA